MNGIVLKDIYAMKKNLIITFSVCIYFIFILFIGSADSSSEQINLVIYFLCGIIPCIFSSSYMFTIDENPYSKQSLYIHSLPIDNKIFALEKYLIIYSLLALSYAVLGIAVIINMMINKYSPNTDVIYYCFLIASLILLLVNIELPITLRFGQAIAAGLIITFICIVIMSGIYAVSRNDELINIIHRQKIIITVAVCIDLTSSWLSYNVTKRIAKKV